MTTQHPYTVTCQRCGKTMRIEKEGDGIHTCTPSQSPIDSSDEVKPCPTITDTNEPPEWLE